MDNPEGEEQNEPSAVASAVIASGVSYEATAAAIEAPSPAPSSMKSVTGKGDGPELMGDSEGEEQNEPSAVASAAIASDVSYDAASAEIETPYPWYTRETPLPVLCYFPSCLAEYESMSEMLKHVQLRHKVKMNDISESYLAKQGNKELALQQKRKRADDKRSGRTPKKKARKEMGEAASQEMPTAVASAAAAPPPDQRHTDWEWVLRYCYVKAAKSGEVLQPLEVFGLAGPGEPVLPVYETRGC